MRRGSLLLLIVLVAAGCGGKGSSSGPPDALLQPEKLTAKAPQLFDVTFKTTAGTFVVNVHRTWSPHGADRFYNLVKNHFYDGQKVFRVVRGFVVQFGISPYPQVSKAWETATIPDDPIGYLHNGRGGVDFASAGPNSRTTQVFINTADNGRLDAAGFTPIGAVTSGMDVVDKLYGGYGDAPTSHQSEMVAQGNAYLEKRWPKLDTIESAKISNESNPALP
jgi:peptidyl-prolyl cis-trans isomerase A (cyclophilin A)